MSDRFWSKVGKTETCWLWTGAISNGYGSFRTDGTAQYAHRVSYTLARGPIPEGLVIDHLCRVTRCVNPDHLEAVPQKINVLRGDSPVAQQARQAECALAHPFTPENTITSKTGKRRCRTCALERARELRQAAKARRRSGFTFPDEDRRHGTIYGYQFGCTCDLCRAANTRDCGKRKKRRQDEMVAQYGRPVLLERGAA